MTIRRALSVRSRLVVVLIALGVPARPDAAGAQPPPHSTTAPTTMPTTRPFEPFVVPGFSFTDQDGNRVTAESLRGRAWVVDFIFTKCVTACPIMTSRMVLLQRMVTDPEVRFVSISVDPANDTPAALKEYQRTWNPDERRWVLLSTDPDGMRAVAADMRVAVREVNMADNPIIHSTFFLLVGPDGVARGQYNAVAEAALMNLAADLRELSPTGGQTAHARDGGNSGSGEGQVDEPSAEAGKRLYENLGCAACHTNAKVGPHLTNLFGRDVMLADNTTVRADDAYLRESILDPGKRLVKGYANTMPKYTGHISAADAGHLAAYVRSLTAGAGDTAAPPAPPPELAVDPICHMDVTVTPDALRADHDGRAYYFCNPMCVERFKKDPARYVQAMPGR